MKRVGTICLSLTHEVKYSLLNETSPKNYGKKLEKVFYLINSVGRSCITCIWKIVLTLEII